MDFLQSSLQYPLTGPFEHTFSFWMIWFSQLRPIPLPQQKFMCISRTITVLRAGQFSDREACCGLRGNLHPTSCEAVVKHCEVLWNVVKHCEMLWNVVKCCETLWCVVKHCEMLWNVVKWHEFDEKFYVHAFYQLISLLNPYRSCLVCYLNKICRNISIKYVDASGMAYHMQRCGPWNAGQNNDTIEYRTYTSPLRQP